MSGFPERDLLERRLGALAELIDTDVQQRLVDDVLARLDAPVRRAPLPASRRRSLLIAGVLASLAVAAVLVLPGPRRTVAHWFGIGNTRIDVRPLPTSTSAVAIEPTVPVTFPLSLHLGAPTTPGDAAARTGLAVALAPGLGEPQGIFVVSPPASGQVVVVYPPSEGLPASSVAGVGALLSTLPGTIDEGLFVKVSSDVESFTFATSTGAVVHAIWLGGAPHDYVFEDADGEPVYDTLRLATHTLLWQDGTTTHRLEADLTRAQAVLIARSIVAG